MGLEKKEHDGIWGLDHISPIDCMDLGGIWASPSRAKPWGSMFGVKFDLWHDPTSTWLLVTVTRLCCVVVSLDLWRCSLENEDLCFEASHRHTPHTLFMLRCCQNCSISAYIPNVWGVLITYIDLQELSLATCVTTCTGPFICLWRPADCILLTVLVCPLHEEPNWDCTNGSWVNPHFIRCVQG